MAEKTVLDIVDTAVKIGLGALISGVATYWVAQHRAKSESVGEYNSRHRALVEKVAEEVEELHHTYLKYWALVIEWLRNSREGTRWPSGRKEELERTKDELFHGFKSLSAAEGKLMLVAEKQGAAALREYGEAVVAFRRSYYMGNKVVTEEQLDSAKSQIRNLRETFFDIVQPNQNDGDCQ